MSPNVQSHIIYNSQDMEAVQESINRWMEKRSGIHIYNRILLSCKEKKKEWNTAICNNVYGPSKYYA